MRRVSSSPIEKGPSLSRRPPPQPADPQRSAGPLVSGPLSMYLINRNTGDQMAKFICPKEWTLQQRLEYYTDRTGGPDSCWEWTGTRMPAGYGNLGWRNVEGRYKIWLAHRLAWEASFGSIPRGNLVLHDCDNPPCCNPKHLHLGDKKTNAREAIDRGLLTPLRGEKSGAAKLTETQVLEIRTDPAPHRVLAKKYGVGKTIIGSIKNRKKWKHL